MPSLSIVIPAYNEEANIASTVEAVSDVAGGLELEHEIIVVNDGSADRTGDIVREMQGRIPNLRMVENRPNRGYGGALKAGFQAADKDMIVFVPGDGQFVFGEVTRFLELAPYAQIVCGYRARREDNALRRLNGWGWNRVITLLFGYLVRDIDCGFKLLWREVAREVSLESNGALIDTEMLAKARALGLRVAEVPVTHLPRRAGEATGANLKVIVKAFRDLAAFRIRLAREIAAQPRPLVQERQPVGSRE